MLVPLWLNLKNKYDKNLRLIFTNTNSLMYEIKTDEAYESFSKNKELFDFSNYSPKSEYCDGWNKLVVGKMKDKAACVAIE